MATCSQMQGFLCTTRPNKNVDFRDYNRVIVILGFNRDSIRKCMLEICIKNKRKHKEIMHHINKTQLYTHCFVPLTCVILGLILSTDCKIASRFSSMDRFTHLYVEFTCRLLRKIVHQTESARKTEISFDDDIRRSLIRIMGLASRGIMSDKRVLVFDSEDLKCLEECDYDVGMMEFSPETHVASFVHLSYQEFLTAVAFSLEWKTNDVLKVRSRCKQNTTFDMVLMYTAGLLGDKETGHSFLQQVDPSITKAELSDRAKQIVNMTHDLACEEVDDKNSKRLRVLMLMCAYEGKLPMEEKWRITDLDLSGTPGGLLPNQLVSLSYYMGFDVITKIK